MKRSVRHFLAFAAAASMTAACAGPVTPLDVGMRERSVDIVLGDQNPEGPPGRPTASNPFPGSTAPGFVTPAAQLGRVPGRPAHGGGSLAPAACAPTNPFEFPEAAGILVHDAPAAGSYRYRRQASLRVADSADGVAAAPPMSLPPEVLRIVELLESPVDGSTRYNVTQSEGAVRTTTTYRVSRGYVAGGLFLEQIVVSDAALPAPLVPAGQSAAGVESFVPLPPVKLMDLPAGPQDVAQQGGGVDPLTGAALTLRYRTVARERVDACGVALEGWRVELSGNYERVGVRGYPISGSIVVAPQLGGRIIADELRLGTEQTPGRSADGSFFSQTSRTTTNSASPESP